MKLGFASRFCLFLLNTFLGRVVCWPCCRSKRQNKLLEVFEHAGERIEEDFDFYKIIDE